MAEQVSERRYDPKEIEPKWQDVSGLERTWEVSNQLAPGEDPGDKAYVLEMLPYPSGEPHIGNLKNYALGDAIAHFRRRTGRLVLHPRGYDAFGLPAANHAIKTGLHPRHSTNESIAAYRHWFHRWGISIDWSREIASHEPSYYRWTQWIFLKLLERGLAYRKEALVNWCPHDQTVLANEQVIDGRCERCGAVVEARQLEQWFFRITDYADRLLEDLETIDWPEHVKTMQRNWIGRSEGAEVIFRCEELGIDYPVFTTRPDTLFGATFFVMAPEHPDVFKLVAGTPQEERLVESGEFTGMPAPEGKRAIIRWLESRGLGRAAVNYRLRDWLISRQRYWGAPIPVVYCERDGMVPVPEDELPVLLPEIEDYAPKGKSPLETAEDWIRVPCPRCGDEGRREADTMDTFVDSSWYFP